eukprot:evm.model.scf_31.4 EVM.evm.TU.scf_31.4   scf_31:52414-66468(+)
MDGAGNGGGKRALWLSPSAWLEAYVGWAVRWPIQIFLALVSLLFLCAVGAAMSNAFSLTEEGNPWTLKANEHAQRDEAISQSQDALGAFISQAGRSDDHSQLNLRFVYEAGGAPGDQNMFTQENLQVAREVENVVLRNPLYKNFCRLNYTNPEDPVCVTQMTPLRFFFEINDSMPELGFGRPFGDPEEGLALMSEDLFSNGIFLTKDFQASGNTSSSYTQSIYSFGLPIGNYTNSNDEEDDQVTYVYDNFLKAVEEDLWQLLGMEAGSYFRTEYSVSGSLRGVKVVFGAGILVDAESTRSVLKDFTWAMLSIASVWTYMMIHTGSLFLSLVGAFEVFMAFPTGLFLYRTVFRVDYFSFLHVLVIFILLGLGADDVFVFTDAFKQTANTHRSISDRMRETARRASKAVFVTSFTTAAAFFATATSDLMPFQAFGIFSGICIVILFVINVLIMPVALVLWAGYTPWCAKRLCCCCAAICEAQCVKDRLPCCTCCHLTIEDGFESTRGNQGPSVKPGKTPRNQDIHGSESFEAKGACAPPKVQVVEGREGATKSSALGVSVELMRPLEKFFNGVFFTFLKRARFVVIVTGVVVFAIGLYFVTTLQAPRSAEVWWPDWHNFAKFEDLTNGGGPFQTVDEDAFTTVHLAWGLKGFDQSDVARWDPEDFGTLQYDEKFDPTSKAAQRHLLGVCAKARETPCSAHSCDASEDGGKYLVRFDRSKPRSFEPCWIEEMHTFVKNSPDLGHPKGLPLKAVDFLPALKAFMATETFSLKYQGQVGLFVDERGHDDLRFILFELKSTYRPPTSSAHTKEVLDEWEEFMYRINEEAAAKGADGVSRGFQSGRFPFVWLFTQQQLISSAVQGIFIVFAIAFIVLNMATGNLVISTLAILTVAGVVATVMGLGVSALMDWEFGTAESIVAVILVGFSMDYSLHLADAYIESDSDSRLDRTRDSLTRLGISVTAGAATTLISGLFLWGAILTFFTKFAFMITSTILASYLWSVLFFPSLAMTFGPEGDSGKWLSIFAFLRSFCCSAG